MAPEGWTATPRDSPLPLSAGPAGCPCAAGHWRPRRETRTISRPWREPRPRTHASDSPAAAPPRCGGLRRGRAPRCARCGCVASGVAGDPRLLATRKDVLSRPHNSAMTREPSCDSLRELESARPLNLLGRDVRGTSVSTSRSSRKLTTTSLARPSYPCQRTSPHGESIRSRMPALIRPRHARGAPSLFERKGRWLKS